MYELFIELIPRALGVKMSGLSATNDFVPYTFPEPNGEFIDFAVHDSFGKQRGIAVVLFAQADDSPPMLMSAPVSTLTLWSDLESVEGAVRLPKGTNPDIP